MEKTKCPKCGNPNPTRNGFTKNIQKYYCLRCPENGGQDYHYCEDQTTAKVTEPKNLKMGISEDQLRAKHDIKFQVVKAVKNLQKGVYLTTPEFIQHAKIRAGAGYRNVIDHPDFDSYRGRAASTVYWGHPDNIKKLKEEGLLQ